MGFTILAGMAAGGGPEAAGGSNRIIPLVGGTGVIRPGIDRAGGGSAFLLRRGGGGGRFPHP